MAAKKPSVLIIGAGVFGVSTAYHLSKQTEAEITLLDRAPFPPAPAASTDINKIIRADYTSSFYADLAYEAIDDWKTWLKQFYHPTGWVCLDEEGSVMADRIREVFKKKGHDPTTDVSLSDIENDDRWGGCLKGTDVSGFQKAYWNPEAGWCEASHATAAVTTEAINNGVKYVVGEVERLIRDDDKVTGVATKDGKTYTADKIVLATGAWTSAIITGLEDELGIDEDARVEKQAQATGVAVVHYKMSDKDMQKLTDMPVVVYGGNGEVIPPPKRNQLLKYTNADTFTHKITTKSGQVISVPPDQDQTIVPEKLQRVTERLMPERVMPHFGKARTADYWRICWDARTPSQDWLLSKHPDSRLQNLFFAVGGSFHSYKFLPNVGRYMVNVLLGISNGEERDKAWSWKGSNFTGRGAHEKTAPVGDLRDYQ